MGSNSPCSRDRLSHNKAGLVRSDNRPGEGRYMKQVIDAMIRIVVIGGLGGGAATATVAAIGSLAAAQAVAGPSSQPSSSGDTAVDATPPAARQAASGCRRPPSVSCVPGTHGVPGGTDAKGCQLPSYC